MSDLTVNLEPLSLANAGGAAFTDQVAEAFEEVTAAFDNDEKYRGKLKARVTVTFDFAFDPESLSTILTPGVQVRLPKRRTIARALSFRKGRLYTEQADHTQLELVHHDADAGTWRGVKE